MENQRSAPCGDSAISTCAERSPKAFQDSVRMNIRWRRGDREASARAFHQAGRDYDERCLGGRRCGEEGQRCRAQREETTASIRGDRQASGTISYRWPEATSISPVPMSGSTTTVETQRPRSWGLHADGGGSLRLGSVLCERAIGQSGSRCQPLSTSGAYYVARVIDAVSERAGRVSALNADG